MQNKIEKSKGIPNFPKFKKLELSDKKEIEKITREFVPYSDFNFANMWAWDIHQKMKISKLNGNLVVIFYDYINNKPFISFIGTRDVSLTTEQLITYSKKNFKLNKLKLIPKVVISKLDKKEFKLIEDRDHHDYVYSISHFIEMNRWPGSGISQRIRQFLKAFPNHSVKHMNLKDINKKEYINIFKKWSNNKDLGKHFELNEFKAFERFLKLDDKNIKALSLHVDDKLIGFTMYEMLQNNYSISHFIKSDVEHHRGINDILNWEEAKELHCNKVKYHNWEQDLGLKGLRYSKEKYSPSFFMKKFTVDR